MPMTPRIIIISAPSGTGKSSIISALIDNPELRLAFSVSATNRAPRGDEKQGEAYFFMDEAEFQERIARDEFIEYVEVYPGRFYGTLKSELERIHARGLNLMLDIDVEGALKVKEKYPLSTLAIFVAPPSVDALRKRLELRGTDSPEVIEERLARSEYEMALASQFDLSFVNDDLNRCRKEISIEIYNFLARPQS